MKTNYLELKFKSSNILIYIGIIQPIYCFLLKNTTNTLILLKKKKCNYQKKNQFDTRLPRRGDERK